MRAQGKGRKKVKGVRLGRPKEWGIMLGCTRVKGEGG